MSDFQKLQCSGYSDSHDRRRATGRTFRSILEALLTVSASKPGEITYFVVGYGVSNAKWCFDALVRTSRSYLGDDIHVIKSEFKLILRGNRILQVITDQDFHRKEFNGCKAIHDHTSGDK